MKADQKSSGGCLRDMMMQYADVYYLFTKTF
jgi:hypothetical protein